MSKSGEASQYDTTRVTTLAVSVLNLKFQHFLRPSRSILGHTKLKCEPSLLQVYRRMLFLYEWGGEKRKDGCLKEEEEFGEIHFAAEDRGACVWSPWRSADGISLLWNVNAQAHCHGVLALQTGC